MSDTRGSILQLSEDKSVGLAEFGLSDGRPVLFFHGWPGSRLEARLADDGCRRHQIRLLSLDRPGIGLSPPRPGPRMVDWTEIVGSTLDNFELTQVDILAVSGGAPYALSCAAQIPDRLRSVTIVCGAPRIDYMAHRNAFIPPLQKLLRWYNNRPHLTILMFAGLLFGMKLLRRPPTLAELREHLSESDVEVMDRPDVRTSMHLNLEQALTQGVGGVLADAEQLLGDWNFDFSSISTPITFWHGTEDFIIPLELARQTFDLVPAAEVHIVESEGHFSLPMRRLDDILNALTSI